MNPADFLTLLYEARATDHGIAVGVSDLQIARQRFLTAKTKRADPNLSPVRVRPSPTDPENEIWLVVVEDAE